MLHFYIRGTNVGWLRKVVLKCKSKSLGGLQKDWGFKKKSKIDTFFCVCINFQLWKNMYSCKLQIVPHMLYTKSLTNSLVQSHSTFDTDSQIYLYTQIDCCVGSATLFQKQVN